MGNSPVFLVPRSPAEQKMLQQLRSAQNKPVRSPHASTSSLSSSSSSHRCGVARVPVNPSSTSAPPEGYSPSPRSRDLGRHGRRAWEAAALSRGGGDGQSWPCWDTGRFETPAQAAEPSIPAVLTSDGRKAPRHAGRMHRAVINPDSTVSQHPHVALCTFFLTKL